MVKAAKPRKCPHTCLRCGGTFAQAQNLRTHVRVVHEERRDHACPHCAAAFGMASTLTAHVRTVHEKRRDHACQNLQLVRISALCRVHEVPSFPQHPESSPYLGPVQSTPYYRYYYTPFVGPLRAPALDARPFRRSADVLLGSSPPARRLAAVADRSGLGVSTPSKTPLSDFRVTTYHSPCNILGHNR